MAPNLPTVLGNCRYQVDLEGVTRYIKSVETIAVETAPTPYNVGMSSTGKVIPTVTQLPTVQQQATRLKLTVVSETGKTEMFDWYDQCNNLGQWKTKIKEVSIRYYDETNKVALIINTPGAYPINYSLATVSADGQEYLTEIVELTCTGGIKLKPQ